MEQARGFQPFDDTELTEGIRFMRTSKYADLVPSRKQIGHVFCLLRVIGEDVNRERTSKSKLALLTGTMVRKRIPDTTPERRRLGMAYRDTIMYLFRRRKLFSASRRKLASSEHPADKGDQLRLI